MMRSKDMQIAAVLGIAHGAATIDVPVEEPPPSPADPFESMVRAAPPKPKSAVDRVFDTLLGRGGATGAGIVSPAQPYRPYRKRKRRETAPVRDAALVLVARAWVSAAGKRCSIQTAAEEIRVRGGRILGRNRRHRVYAMAIKVERGAP